MVGDEQLVGAGVVVFSAVGTLKSTYNILSSDELDSLDGSLLSRLADELAALSIKVRVLAESQQSASVYFENR
jgi:hypothetical protein